MNESKIIIRNLKASFDRGRFARWLLVGILVFGLGWSVNLIWFKPYSIEMFFERTFLRFALNHPEENTEYRMLEILGIHTGHNQLNDITEAQIQRNVDFVIEQYDMLQSYKRSQQTPKELFSTGLLKNYFEDAIYHLQFPYDEFPFDHLKGPHVQVPFFLVNSHLIDKFNDAEDYLDRITKLPKKLKQSEEYARLLMGYNALPPRPIIENMIEQVQIVQEDGTDYNVMYVDLAEKMEVIKGIPEEPLRDLRYFHRRSIEDLILPAYNDFYLFLNEIKGQAPENPSVNRITEDESYYRYLLSRHLTVDNQLLFTDLTPDSLFQMGQIELSQKQELLNQALDRQIGENTFFLEEKLGAVHQEMPLFYSTDRFGRRSFLGDFSLIAYNIGKEAQALFGIGPTQEFEILRMPDYLEPFATRTIYYPGSLDLARNGTLYCNLYDMNEIPKYSLTALALWNLAPGKHFQKQIQHESDAPSFRKVISFAAFEEGWCSYAADKMIENGLHANDLTLIGIYHWEVILAAQFLTDIGIHHHQWGYEEARSYFKAQTGLSDREVKAFVDQCIVQPGKAVAYLYGRTLFEQGEKQCQEQLGKLFDLRKYWHFLHEMGPAPANLWQSQLQVFMDSQNQAG